MDVRELRIGNWVNDCINEKNVIINGFHSTTIWLLNNNNNQYQVACSIPKPIPLTEEILLKCGFKKLDKYTFVRNGWFIHFRVKKDSFIYNKRTHIKYLHQLQNLYFALTGEELNIEL